MKAIFEGAFLKAIKKHSSIKKLVQKKVDMIIEKSIALGEPLKDNWQGFYSCPVKRSFIIIYLYCSRFFEWRRRIEKAIKEKISSIAFLKCLFCPQKEGFKTDLSAYFDGFLPFINRLPWPDPITHSA